MYIFNSYSMLHYNMYQLGIKEYIRKDINDKVRNIWCILIMGVSSRGGSL